jgi:hypothetical protein
VAVIIIVTSFRIAQQFAAQGTKGKRSIPETNEICVLQQEEVSSKQSLAAKQLQALLLPTRKQPNRP